MSGTLPSVLALGSLALVALGLTLSRFRLTGDRAELRSAAVWALLTTAAQALHFAEELATGFERALPGAFGLPPMSREGFVAFNVAWLLVWLASAWALTRRWRPALFPLWFLALGCLLNGLAHPLLALRAGSYFPGLGTSLVVAVFGGLLLNRLRRLTSLEGTAKHDRDG